MYQAYISNDSIMFIRHYGTYEGAESATAILSTLELNPIATQVKGVFFDVREVTDVSLEDTDRAQKAFLLRKLASYGQKVSLASLVAVVNPENVVANKTLAERNRRVKGAIFDFETIKGVYSVPEALKILGLPADYCIEYRS
jgi:hypothetical protein